MSTTSKRITTWKVADLKPHPKQVELFAEPPLHEIEELAADMDRNGQLQPVEILADGTTIAGHKRTKAARLLDWEKLDVWVRDDLTGDPVAAERRLIEDNLTRSHFGPLALARCYKRLKLLEMKHPGSRLMNSQQQELRDLIGKRLGRSGRSSDRYLRVLDSPQPIQDAVAAGRLPITVAEKVASLDKPHREQIAKEIQQGDDPKAVARRVLAKAPRRVRNANDVKDQFLHAVEHAVADLNGRLGEVRWINAREENALREGKKLIGQLQKRAVALRKDPASLDDSSGGEEDGSSAEEIANGTVALPMPPANMAGRQNRQKHS